MIANNKSLPLGDGWLPLIPRADIYLRAFGDGDDARFARLFRATWRRIPRNDRRRLLRYWRPIGPNIELLSDWSSWDDNNSAEFLGKCGECGKRGMLIRFWVNAVDRMPDPHVLTLIAHELMHACLWAMGQRDNALDENFVQNCVVSDWNFDEFALQEWIDANADSLRSSLATCSTRIDEELS